MVQIRAETNDYFDYYCLFIFGKGKTAIFAVPWLLTPLSHPHFKLYDCAAVVMFLCTCNLKSCFTGK